MSDLLRKVLGRKRYRKAWGLISEPCCQIRTIQVGKSIQMVRKQRKLTLPELADRAGVSKGLISKIENGGNFTIQTLYRLAAALQVEPSSLLR